MSRVSLMNGQVRIRDLHVQGYSCGERERERERDDTLMPQGAHTPLTCAGILMWMSRVLRVNAPHLTYEWGRCAYVAENCRVFIWIRRITRVHITRVNTPRLTYEWAGARMLLKIAGIDMDGLCFTCECAISHLMCHISLMNGQVRRCCVELQRCLCGRVMSHV